MPISFTEVASMGDVMPNNRHTVYFPNLAGVFDGRMLTILHGNVSMPPMQVGQITLKQLGWSVSFAGIRTQTNTFTIEFWEVVGAPVIKALARWQDICAGFKTHRAKMKADYVTNPKCVAYDTVGNAALTVEMINVWPVNITYGQFSEETQPMQVSCEFAIDAIDIVDLQTNEGDFSMATINSKSTPSLWYESRSGNQQQLAINQGAFQQSDNVVKQLGLTDTQVTGIIQRFF